MLFGFRTITFRQYPLHHAINEISKAGYDGVELCFENDQLRPSILKPNEINKIKRVLKDRGLEISATSLHSDFVADEKNFEDILKAIKLTEIFGNEILIIAPGYIQKLDKKILRKKLEEKLRLLLPEAEKRGVVLALEPEPAMIIENGREASQIVKMMSYQNLKINFDVGHFQCVGDSIESSITLLNKHIVHTHFEDIKNRVHKHLIPGEGNLNFIEVFNALKDICYEGFATIDLFDVSDPEKAASVSVTRLKSIVSNSKTN